MKKLLSVLLIALFIFKPAYSQTFISGIISSNATWTLANSPYVVTANTVIMPNVIINVQPGVLIKLMANVQISLRGTFNCIGTSSDSIWFTANDGLTHWEGFYVDNSSYNPKVNFRYCSVTLGNGIFSVVNYNASTDTLIKLVRCTFKNNSGDIIDENSGIKTHKAYIDSCIFSNNPSHAMYEASNFTIKNSKFYGVSASPLGRAIFSGTYQNTIIDNCEFSGFNDLAVAIQGSITNSTFYNNHTAIATNSNGTPEVHYNNIYDNQIGIKDWQYGAINSPTQITNNRFCNTTNVRKVYGADSYYINNCWCLNDSLQIEASIWDFFDAGSLGIVYFYPYVANCSIIVGSADNNEKIAFSLFPNPASDKLNIEISGSIGEKSLSVYNIQGQLMWQQTARQEKLEIDIARLSKGLYLLKLITTEGSVVKKFIKE